MSRHFKHPFKHPLCGAPRRGQAAKGPPVDADLSAIPGVPLQRRTCA